MTFKSKLLITTSLAMFASLGAPQAVLADCVPFPPANGDAVTCSGTTNQRIGITADDVTLTVEPGAVVSDPDNRLAIEGLGQRVSILNGGMIRQTAVPLAEFVTGVQVQQDSRIENQAGGLVDIAGARFLTGLQVREGGFLLNNGTVQITVSPVTSDSRDTPGPVEGLTGAGTARVVNGPTGVVRIVASGGFDLNAMDFSSGGPAGEMRNEGLVELDYSSVAGSGFNTTGMNHAFSDGGFRMTNAETGRIVSNSAGAVGMAGDVSDIVLNAGQIEMTSNFEEADFLFLRNTGMTMFDAASGAAPGEARNTGTITMNGPGGLGVYAGINQPFVNTGTILTTGTGGVSSRSILARSPVSYGPNAIYLPENEADVLNDETGVLRVEGVNSSAVLSGTYARLSRRPVPGDLPGSRFTNRGLVEGQRAGVEALGGLQSDEFFLINEGRIVALAPEGDGVLIQGTSLEFQNSGTVQGTRTGLRVQLHVPDTTQFDDYPTGTIDDLTGALNRGTIRGGTGVLVTGDLEAFTNTGRTEGTADGADQGAIRATGRITGLTNNGTVLTSGEGAVAIGTASNTQSGGGVPDLGVTNTARLEATRGVALQSAGTGQIDNAGSLRGRDGAIVLQGSGTADTDGSDILNRVGGTISSDTAPAILISGQDATIRNEGAIDGGASGVAIRFASGFDNRLVVGAGSSISGIVEAGGTGTISFGLVGDDMFDVGELGPTGQYRGFSAFEKTGPGILALTGTVAGSGVGRFDLLGGGVAMEGAALDSALRLGTGTTLTGTGRLAGLTALAGSTLSPGSLSMPTGTLRATGAVSLSGEYLVDIAANGSSDMIVSDTSIALSGAALKVNGIGYPTGYPDTQDYTILSAPTITGAFASVEDNLPDVDVAVTYGTSQTRISYDRTTAPAPVLSDDGILGDGLQGLAHDARLVNGLLMGQSAFGPAASSGPVISSRGQTGGPFSFWLGGVAAEADRGYDSSTQAFLMGAESYRSSDRSSTVLGLSVGLSQADHTRAGSKLSAESVLLGVYAGYRSGPLEMRGALSFGRGDLDTARFIAGPNVTARGKTESLSRALSLEASYDVAPKLGLAEGTRVAPLVRFDHANSRIDGYTETGAGVLNRAVGSADWTRNWLGLGVRVEGGRKPGSKLRTSAEIRIDQAFGDDFAAVPSALTLGGAGFTARGRSDADTSLAVGFGLSADVGRNGVIDARLDGSFADGRSSGAVSLSLRLDF